MIGVFGIFSLVVALFLIRHKDAYLLAAIFFAPFYECAVFEFESFHLQPGHFFLILYLVYAFITSLSLNKGVVKMIKPQLPLLLFFIGAVLSIVVAFALKTNVKVYGIGNGGVLEDSLVDKQNFTQLAYLFFGLILCYSLRSYCLKSYYNCQKVVKMVAYSSICIIVIGFYQLFAAKTGLPFVQVFRNGQHTMWQSLTRVQSTMGEASFLGQYLSWSLVFFISGYKWKRVIYKYIAIIVLIIEGILTRSSTFLIGALIVWTMHIFFQSSNIFKLGYYLALVVIVFFLFRFLYYNNQYVYVLIVNTRNKFTMTNFSGITRAALFLHMMRVGLENPIFGIGYGGGRSTDVYATIFCTTGLIGVCSFFGYFVVSFLKIIKRKPVSEFGILLIISTLVSGISVPDISYLSIWIVIGFIGLCTEKTIVIGERGLV